MPVLDIANQVANLEVGIWAILIFTLDSISLSLLVLIFASVLDWREEVAGNGMVITLCAYSSLSILSLSYAMSLSEIQIFLPASKGLIGHTFHFVHL